MYWLSWLIGLGLRLIVYEIWQREWCVIPAKQMVSLNFMSGGSCYNTCKKVERHYAVRFIYLLLHFLWIICNTDWLSQKFSLSFKSCLHLKRKFLKTVFCGKNYFLFGKIETCKIWILFVKKTLSFSSLWYNIV